MAVDEREACEVREASAENVTFEDSVDRCDVPTVAVAVAVPVLLPVVETLFVTSPVVDIESEGVAVDVALKAIENVDNVEWEVDFVEVLDNVVIGDGVKDI